MTVVAYDYKGLRVIAYPRHPPPNGLKDDTWPIGPNTVTQHLDRFWTLTCFDNSCGFQRAFDERPLGLASLSN